MAPARHVWLLVAPLPAILLGAAVAGASHVPLMAFLPNLLGLLLGGLGLFACLRLAPATQERALPWLGAAAFLALVATLGFAGIEGVHRWIRLGPLRLNASASFLPWILAGLGASSAKARGMAVGLVLGAQLLHVAQPDAGQATALAVGALAMLATGTVLRGWARVAVGLTVVGLAAYTWLRVDPLPPVEHVERILVLALSRGFAWAAAAVVAGLLLLAPMGPAVRRSGGASAGLALSLALYFCATIAVTFFGNFPVPVMGAGAGPVLGWCALAALCSRRTAVASS
ncbi:putative peptidoglycan glycosyltransferase FtsW/RodA [Pyxidicoccus xibeiensis]|uniref:hypothetical protein n=1 Tax=Pyxidicoccus xibeiensis TaxID=2906759 RepID=UPI0020A70DCC|nr:hypothetical protein [Pyxidicoccus xibeiensis]MCP3141284.1 hypothetical protein [Pyxidicoccus xibeiensis]